MNANVSRKKREMRRKTLVAALVVSVLFSGGAAFAFENEPEGFRGLKWGDAPTKDMALWDVVVGLELYILPGEKLSLGEAELELVTYCFYEDRLMGVNLHFFELDNYALLKEICKTKFGKELEHSVSDLYWVSSQSQVSMDYLPVKNQGVLTLGSFPIFEEYIDAIKAAQAKESPGGW